MPPRLLSSILFLCTLTLLASQANAQSTTGSLEGRVTDAAGEASAGVEVTIDGSGLQGTRTLLTRTDGRFHFLAVPLGRYSVRFQSTSGARAGVDGVEIRLGLTTSLGDVLLSAGRQATEDIVVTASAPIIDPTNTELGGNLSAEEFDDLPIARDYRSMATLLPHANTSYFGDGVNFGGGTGLENKYFIDGVDNTDPKNGGSATSLPYNFVEEVEVRTGGYQAEYRASLGGVVNAVTRSGSNELEAQAFGFFVNNSLTADPQLASGEAPPGDFAMYDYGASVGGAIVRDRLWYFGAYNLSTESKDVTVPGLGETLTDESTTHRFAGKLNWRLNPSNNLSLSVLGDPGTTDGASPNLGWHGLPTGYASSDPLLYDAKHGGYTVAASGEHWLGDGLLLESDLSGVWQRSWNTPASEDELYFFDAETGIVSGGGINDDTTDVFAGTAGLAATLPLEDHTLKTGISYRERHLEPGGTGAFLIRTFDPVDGESFRYQEWAFLGTFKNRSASVFLQDSWRMNDRLRLNLGMRWDGEYLIDSRGNTAQSISDGWQPRLGFTFQPSWSDRDQIFGSVGRFYQEISLASLSYYFTDEQHYAVYDFTTDPRLGAPADTTFALNLGGHIQEEDPEIQGQYYDEFILGYERGLGERARLSLRGVYRTLGAGLEDGFSDANGDFFWGNPGRGNLSDLPEMERSYAALELSFSQATRRGDHMLLSYVLSRTHGNYPGIFPPEYGGGDANVNAQWDAPDQIRNGYPFDAFSDGLLPNDRTHVFKASGAYVVRPGLQVGSSFQWMSGTPLNEFGASSWDSFYNVFLQPRGEAGRTPAIWDLGFRISYSLPQAWSPNVRPRLLLDLLHVGGPREAVNYDQRHYADVDGDGNPVNPNPNYGAVTSYQPPMTVRLGMEVGF